MSLNEIKVILASASPRRKELLGALDIAFEICASGADESYDVTDPGEIVKVLSYAKAEDVFDQHAEDCLVIGADTIVFADGRVLGKPADAREAYEMLDLLQGNTHEVYTGVTLFLRKNAAVTQRSFFESTAVTFYPMSEDEINGYIQSGDPMDKAGAYGIQSGAMRFVKQISGDYNTVVGLPVAALYQELKQMIGFDEDPEVG